MGLRVSPARLETGPREGARPVATPAWRAHDSLPAGPERRQAPFRARKTPRDRQMTLHVDPNAAARPDSGLFGLDPDPAEARVHVVAVPFDATASYRKGAHRGPAAVLRASHQVDLYDVATGRPYEAGIALLAPDPRLAAWNERASPLADHVIELGGDVEHDPGARIALEEVNAIGTHLNGVVREATERALDEERLPVILGGDHSVPFGAIEAAAARFPGLGVLHVDAHADLRARLRGLHLVARLDHGQRRAPDREPLAPGAGRAPRRVRGRGRAHRGERAGASARSSTATGRTRAWRAPTCARWRASGSPACPRTCGSRSTSTASSPRCARTPGRPCPAASTGASAMSLARRARALGPPRGRPRPVRGQPGRCARRFRRLGRDRRRAPALPPDRHGAPDALTGGRKPG